MKTYYFPKLNQNYDIDYGDDFYEIETYIGNQKINHEIDDWPDYATPDAAIEVAKTLSLTGQWTAIKVVVYGCQYKDKTTVLSDTTIWDSNIIFVGLNFNEA